MTENVWQAQSTGFMQRSPERTDYQQIGDIFDEAAGNEQAHAEIWLRMLNEDTFPMLEEMLQDAGNGEQYEWKQMYRDSQVRRIRRDS